jgi:adenine-specific DNA-methyltransferase
VRHKLIVGREATLFAEPAATDLGQPRAAPMPSGLSLELDYSLKADLAHRQRHAQFFTPPAMARLMAEMAQPEPGRTVLEPACGTGALVAALRERTPGLRITAIDIDPAPLAHLRGDGARADGTEVIEGDFLAWGDERRFDLVVANPPYLKYQHFDCPDAVYARLSSALGVTISKFSNLYLLFILEGYRRLRPGGRLVYLVPGEWTNANFGTPFKQFLAREGCLSRLIYFSHTAEAFDDALTTSSIIELLKPADSHPAHGRFLSLYADESASLDEVRQALAGRSSGGHVFACEREIVAMASEKKWDHVLRAPVERLMPLAGWRPLRDWCSSRRGIATGANEFFHLSPSSAAARGIAPEHLLPCVGGARHVKGLVFSAGDYTALHEGDQPCLLLNMNPATTAGETEYIRHGESLGLPKRYLLSVRKPWYRMERANPAPIWIGVFGRSGLRVIRNRSGVAQLTTFHGLRPASDDPVLIDALVVLLNAPAARHAIGRTQRVFGAGLEKVEPADLLDIVLPDLRAVARADLERLAQLLEPMDRAWRAHGAFDAALAARMDAAAAAAIASVQAEHISASAVRSTSSLPPSGTTKASMRPSSVSRIWAEKRGASIICPTCTPMVIGMRIVGLP